MPELATMTFVGVIVLAVLVVAFIRVRQRDLLGAVIEKKRKTSTIVSRAEYVEGAEKMPVALSLAGGTLYYENSDFEASFDLDRIDEVEYDDDLATGRSLGSGCRVLRLRSHGATFEFVLDKSDCHKWSALLPPRSYGHQTAAAV